MMRLSLMTLLSAILCMNLHAPGGPAAFAPQHLGRVAEALISHAATDADDAQDTGSGAPGDRGDVLHGVCIMPLAPVAPRCPG